MATLTSLVDRVRMELGDPGKSFVWQAVGGGTNRFEMPYSPVNAATLAVFVDGVDVSDAVECEEHTGVLTFDVAPSAGAQITAQGSYFRFFTTTELTTIVDAALREHLYNRTDAFGRGMTVENLPVVEEYPVALLGAVQALYTLATDAAFDINITTPDGVAVPRAERYRQLMDMIAARKEQYDDLCKALNIGLTRIEVFTLRRTSRTTNRYVPIYAPQEIDDRSMPVRIFLPIPTYGGSPVPSKAIVKDLTFTQGDKFGMELVFPFDLTQYKVQAQARLYPGAAAIAAEFTCAVSGSANVHLSLTPEQTKRMPLKSVWDLQLTRLADANDVHTYMQGAVFVPRQVTTGVADG